MRTRRIAAAVTAAFVITALAACGAPGSAGGGGDGGTAAPVEEPTGDGPYSLEIEENPEFDEGTTMAALADAGAMTIGSKFDQPLFGLLGTGNVPEGFDVAIGALVASKLGIPFDSIEWIETPSNIRETAIQNGDADIVVATYTITDARKELVDFAGPYFAAGQAIMVLADNEDISSPEDLEGQPVCSVEGSTPAARIVDEYGAQLVATDVYSNCLDPLRNGDVVAITTDNVILSGFVAQNEGEFKLAGDGETFSEEPYGVGLPKDDQEFRDFVNDVLEESFEDGTWARLFEETAGAVLPVPDPPAVDRY
jgi:glutamate transport system substrate-binding protein